ncbi:ATP-binding cassette domain-containing protein [Paenibacillus sp. HJL G12]|uniref:ATP-binding cassette domain-containing protein n=1 Tax=Paenibacillus dendrobii TaxID=2691084 RepID=A0A7X3IHZ0_9BACL|nr:ATP-binding cassette domain-containing protein [Paenibacillus dendrobii]MWV43681.1 ATP-binding cassette domain-containing protein [Paenibacillus dendrobii]
MIEVCGLHKQFKTPVVKEGRFAGLRTLFTREYRMKEAVKDISFTISQGDFVGYIGPNGAGKSTTIKMLTGILHPSSGEVKIGGINPHHNRRHVAKRLGVVFGQRSQLWWDLPVKDSYDILAHMYKVASSEKEKRLDELGELLDLKEFWLTPVRKLSLGQRMRADIAASMLHDPDVLFLDEPTIGLDVTAKRSIRGFLKKLNSEYGKTILLTTHDMDDIEQLCQRVMVINHGKLSYEGTIGNLRDKIGLPTRIHVTFHGTYQMPIPKDLSLPVELGLDAEHTFQIVEASSHEIHIEANRQQVKAMDILRMVSGWGEVADIHMEEPDFEDIIHRIY